jgi:hypothetical protein
MFPSVLVYSPLEINCKASGGTGLWLTIPGRKRTNGPENNDPNQKLQMFTGLPVKFIFWSAGDICCLARFHTTSVTSGGKIVSKSRTWNGTSWQIRLHWVNGAMMSMRRSHEKLAEEEVRFVMFFRYAARR